MFIFIPTPLIDCKSICMLGFTLFTYLSTLLLVASHSFPSYSQKICPSDLVAYSDTALYSRTLHRLRDDSPEKCECRKRCVISETGVFSRDCVEYKDTCSDCQKQCGERECPDWTLVAEGDGDRSCEYADLTPCHCCVRPVEPYWLDICQWAPVYNSTCGDNVCELCTVTCGHPWCHWLDPEGDHSPFDPHIAHIVALYIGAVLNIDYLSACAPDKVEEIIMDLSGYIALDKCQKIDLTDAQVELLEAFLAGELTAPLCPSCQCPSDADSGYDGFLLLSSLESSQSLLVK